MRGFGHCDKAFVGIVCVFIQQRKWGSDEIDDNVTKVGSGLSSRDDVVMML